MQSTIRKCVALRCKSIPMTGSLPSGPRRVRCTRSTNCLSRDRQAFEALRISRQCTLSSGFW
eukprot:890620-Prymnesium_polylepis.2